MIRIRTTLTSDTPHLPELGPLVGRAVTITVEEVPAAAPDTPSEHVQARREAADRLRHSTYDWDAVARQDAVDAADARRDAE